MKKQQRKVKINEKGRKEKETEWNIKREKINNAKGKRNKNEKMKKK